MNTNKCKIAGVKHTPTTNISALNKFKQIDISTGNESSQRKHNRYTGTYEEAANNKNYSANKLDSDRSSGNGKRGRTLLEKHKNPKDRISRKFFSEEKYHYSQNLQIEEELRQFK